MTDLDLTSHDMSNQAIRATWWGIAGNTALAGLKLVVGFIGHSAALIADGFHSLSDVISSFIVLIGLKIATIPADKEHPYGHGKAEALAARFISLVLVGIGCWTVYDGVITIREDHAGALPSLLAVAAAVVSIAVKEGLFWYKIGVAERTGSQAIRADAWHHRSDALSSVVALIAIAITIYGGSSWVFVDHIGAVVIGVIIASAGGRLFFDSSKELMDAVLLGAPVERVRQCGQAVAGVKRIEKVFVRKAGMDLLIDVHVHVDGNLTVYEGHRIGHAVRGCIMDSMPVVKSVLVHIEPEDDAEQDGDNELAT